MIENMGSPFQPVADIRTELGESPVWSARDNLLALVDIAGRAAHRYDPASGRHKISPMPEEIAFVAPAQEGGWVAGMRTGIFLLDDRMKVRRRIAGNPGDSATSRFNDGGTDPLGRLIIGTMDETKAGRGALYRLDGESLTELVGGITTSNGVAFSPDGRVLYHSDTPRFTVWRAAYDPAGGTISDHRVFARREPTEQDRGRPDGAAMDAEGCYWSALYEGGRILRHAPDGTVIAEYPVPARCPTMPAFGGADMRTLFVTSVRDKRPQDELRRLPLSGALFAMRVEVPGVPRPPVRLAPG